MAPSIEDRFMRHVCAAARGCIDWTGAKDGFGYGLFRVTPGKIERAHRVALRLTGVAVTADSVVMHSCDRPCCVNPDHLRVGTKDQNNADRDAKGRHVKLVGSSHGNARFSEQDILDIRSSTESDAALGVKYSARSATIGNIRARRTWKHL